MKRISTCFILLLLSSLVFGADPEDVKTIQLYPFGNEIGYPIIELGSNQQLVLEFDILGDDAPYVYFDIQHFSSDWSKKDLNPLDYSKGFQTGSIDDFEFSFNTNQLYSHYEFTFPNNQLDLTASGNYKIIVFEDSVDEPLFEKEFYITEQVVQIAGSVENAVQGNRLQSHHQVDFIVNTESLPSNNPRQDFEARVIQNLRTDNSLQNIQPNRMNDKTLYFNNPFDFNFEAGNEFRWFNIRSVRYKTDNVVEIQSKDGRTDVWLKPALPRKRNQFIIWEDFNGQYVVDHQEGNQPDIDADYVYVHFTLKEEAEYKNKKVYLFGALTDWKIDERYLLEMNDRQNLLERVLYLKQGNYDYQFIVEEEEGVYTVDPIEGNFYRTVNQYTIFVYYKPFGARYDRLVGVKYLNSRLN